MKRRITPRDITPHEAEILDWLLEHAATCDVIEYRAKPSAALRVVGGCDCGCSSLEFDSETEGPKAMLADALAIYPDRQQAGLILWGREGEIVSVEVYEMHPVANRVPEIRDLCRWEDRPS